MSARKKPPLSEHLKWNLGQNLKAFIFSNTRADTHNTHRNRKESMFFFLDFAVRLVFLFDQK